MTTETTLANLALGHLGAARITDLSENTVAAEHIRRMWDTTRDQLLRAYPWNFAIKRLALSASSTAPAFGWAYAYPLPGDCIRVLEVNGCQAGVGNVPYEVESGQVLSDMIQCKVRYLRRVEQVSAWDPLFCELFGYELAKAIAPSFTLQTSAIAQLDALAQPARMRAEEANASETRPRVIAYHDRPSPYEAARYGSHFPAVINPADPDY